MSSIQTAIPAKQAIAYVRYGHIKDPDDKETSRLFDMVEALSVQALDETDDGAKFTITMNLIQFTLLKGLLVIGNEAVNYSLEHGPDFID